MNTIEALKVTLLCCMCFNVVTGKHIGQRQNTIQRANTFTRGQWNPSAWFRPRAPVARQKTMLHQNAHVAQVATKRPDQVNTVYRPALSNTRRLTVPTRRFNVFHRSQRVLNNRKSNSEKMLRINLNLNRPFSQRNPTRPINHRIHIKTEGQRRKIQISHSLGIIRDTKANSLRQATDNLKQHNVLDPHMDSTRTYKLDGAATTGTQNVIHPSPGKAQTSETQIRQTSDSQSHVNAQEATNAKGILLPEVHETGSNSNKMTSESLAVVPQVAITNVNPKSTDVISNNQSLMTDRTTESIIPTSLKTTYKNTTGSVKTTNKDTPVSGETTNKSTLVTAKTTSAKTTNKGTPVSGETTNKDTPVSGETTNKSTLVTAKTTSAKTTNKGTLVTAKTTNKDILVTTKTTNKGTLVTAKTTNKDILVTTKTTNKDTPSTKTTNNDTLLTAKTTNKDATSAKTTNKDVISVKTTNKVTTVTVKTTNELPPVVEPTVEPLEVTTEEPDTPDGPDTPDTPDLPDSETS